ncbi:MAG: FtsX-like permease family protein [Rhodanobacteraceae bacterium]|nr:FtsX-like permease family protein [Rhodanobacteraceae bacterium]
MDIKPILKTLLRNKIGVAVIAAQVALTLAIASNVFYVVADKVNAARQPTGADEANVFQIRATSYRETKDPIAQQKIDEAVLRAIPGVTQVAMVNQVPLGQSGNNSGFFRKRDQQQSTSNGATYESASSMVDTLGLKLIQGRDFLPGEYLEFATYPSKTTSLPVIISETMARVMFPELSDYPGQVFYWGKGDDAAELRVVGVVETLATPWGRTSWGSKTGGESLIMPVRMPQDSPQYIVRTAPGTQAEVIKAAEAALVKPSDGRLLQPANSLLGLRERRYRNDYFLSSMMATMTGLLVLVTASGILGMASFWVGQRRKQIGVRRALGARRSDILRYYLLENFIVTSIGIGIGIVLALLLNQIVAESLSLSRLPLSDLAIGMVLLWLVGQAATFAPARRASLIAPATATRSV